MQNTRKLLQIMAQLRDSDAGCPWDKKQTFNSLIPYLIEETYEVVDAIERKDYLELQDELGDLLLQVVFHSQIATESRLFDFEAVAGSICEKLTRRHPHVFADVQYQNDEERRQAWEALKRQERREKDKENGAFDSVLDGIPESFPALMQAEKIQNRASDHGFDWPDVAPVFAKVEEELAEVHEAFEMGEKQKIHEEVGDLLFVAVNLARHLDINPELALKHGNRKFKKRFNYIEKKVCEEGRELKDCALAELDGYWEQSKLEN